MDDRDDPFDDVFEQMNEMIEEMFSQGGFPGAGAGGDFSFGGARFTRGPDDEGSFETFGDWNAGGAAPQEGSTAHVDVMKDDEEVRVVADLPGVEKEDIDLKVAGDRLHIQASNEDRSYDEVAQLPVDVDEDSGGASYNNGVLQVSFDRDEDETSKQIDID